MHPDIVKRLIAEADWQAAAKPKEPTIQPPLSKKTTERDR
jgi:hypothetical protein